MAFSYNYFFPHMVLWMCSVLIFLEKWCKWQKNSQKKIAKNSKNEAKTAKNSLKGPEVFGQVGSNVTSNINTKLHKMVKNYWKKFKMTPKMAGMGLQCLGNSQIKISIRNKGVKIGLEIFSFLICRENFKDSKWKE